ncbi:MAG: beta-hexosaminidase [Ruminococcaceae bacterium]|nr:beta-hexosaminidase [Oscillospiraceae bacterium]
MPDNSGEPERMMKRVFFWILMTALCLLPACGTDTASVPLVPESQQVSESVGQLVISALPSEEDVPEEPPAEETPPEEVPEPADPAKDVVDTILSSMSLEEKVGQMLLIGCPADGAETVLETYPLGGYIFFSHHFAGKDAAAVREMTASIQAASRIPLLMAVDEEGGSVTRVSRHASLRAERFRSPRELYESGGMTAVEADVREKSAFLLDLGLNVNLGPVCDLSNDPDDFIYPRAFAADPAVVSDYVRRTVTIMEEAQMGSVLKHFPGYGGSADTHVGVVVDPRTQSEIIDSAILPFVSGTEAGADGVMVCHMILEHFDAERPASLSPAIYSLLRESLGDDVVVMTDDLDMGGITDYTDGATASVSAVQAGCDLILSSDYATHYTALLNAVQDGVIAQSRIEESVRRILLWKYELGLFA